MKNNKVKKGEMKIKSEEVEDMKKKDEVTNNKEYMPISLEVEEQLKQIIDKYIQNDRGYMKEFLEEYKELVCMEEAIKKIVEETAIAKRHRQKRKRLLSRDLYQQLEERLIVKKNRQALEKCQDFRSIMRLVYKEVETIPRLGKLTVYDVSLGIGAYLCIYPESVYLHCGAKKGAEALEEKRIVALKVEKYSRDESYELIQRYPECFEVLTEYEIENLLCIYKEQLRELVVVIKGETGIYKRVIEYIRDESDNR